jgi:UDP-glucose 4-epimerase
VLALLDAGYDDVVVDNLVTGFDWAVDARAALVRCDVADDGRVRDAIRDHRVRAIMHFAGSVVVPESVSDPLKYYRNNTAASRALIESAVQEGVPHFIFSSTAATYGTPEKVPVAEGDPTVPINPYGTSKLMTEAMLRDVAAAHPINYCALRYFNVAGADPQGRSGQSTAGATHLIKVAVEAATGKRDGVGVFGTDFPTPDGTGVRDYIHVSDLAAAHVSALELLLADPARSHTLNCGYGRGFSVNQVLDAVDRVTNVTIDRRYEGRRAGDPAELVADNSAILAALPWRPQRDDLETIVQDALAWERKLAERRQ